MTPLKRLPRCARTLLLLTLLLSGCAASLPPLPPVVVKEAAIPPLAREARQPEIPSECLPTCSAALTVERESWLNTLTLPEPLAAPVSVPTTP